MNLARLGRDADARATLRAGLMTDSDTDVRKRLLVNLAALTDEVTERESLFREAVALNGHLVAAASAAVALRTK